MMGTAGDKRFLPGSSFERSWSGVPENDIHNVEAEGSNPFTSTKKPSSQA
jgi:hypothetical protein